MGVLANPNSNQAMVPSKQKRTHAVFCVSSAHRLAPTSKPRFVGEKICLNQVIRSLPASKAVIKKKAATEYADGLYPAFSASGQDVWLPDYRYNCHGVVVSAVGARCGKAFKASGKWNVVANTHPLALDEERIDWDYAWRLLNNENWWIKSGSGQPFVKVRESLKRSIHLPPLSIQKQFAANLRGVESQISIAQRSLAALDSLVKSRFVEMFGDPVVNPKGWDVSTIKKTAITYGDGPFGSNLKSADYVLSGVRVIRLGNIMRGEFSEKDQSYVSYEKFESLRKYECIPGEVVIATLGDPILRACIVPDFGVPSIHKADCMYYETNKEMVLPVFAMCAINQPSMLQRALLDSHGQTRARINSTQAGNLPMILPPMDLQQEFADFAAQVDKSRFVRDHEMNFR